MVTCAYRTETADIRTHQRCPADPGVTSSSLLAQNGRTSFYFGSSVCLVRVYWLCGPCVPPEGVLYGVRGTHVYCMQIEVFKVGEILQAIMYLQIVLTTVIKSVVTI